MNQNKIGYPCIFCKSPEEAIGNLLRLIVNKQGGYEEGAAVWRAGLREWLDGNHDMNALNGCGASFREEEWRAILQGVIAGLDESLEDSANH